MYQILQECNDYTEIEKRRGYIVIDYDTLETKELLGYELLENNVLGVENGALKFSTLPCGRYKNDKDGIIVIVEDNAVTIEKEVNNRAYYYFKLNMKDDLLKVQNLALFPVKHYKFKVIQAYFAHHRLYVDCVVGSVNIQIMTDMRNEDEREITLTLKDGKTLDKEYIIQMWTPVDYMAKGGLQYVTCR